MLFRSKGRKGGRIQDAQHMPREASLPKIAFLNRLTTVKFQEICMGTFQSFCRVLNNRHNYSFVQLSLHGVMDNKEQIQNISDTFPCHAYMSLYIKKDIQKITYFNY